MTATVDRQQLLVAASTVGAIGFLLAVQHFTTPRGAARHGKRSASAMHHRSANATASQLPHSRPRDESLRPSQRRPAAHTSSQPISTTNTQLTVSSLQHHRSRDGKPAAKEELHTPDVVPTLALHHLHRRPTDTPHTPHGAAHTARPEDATNTTNNTTPTRTSAVVRRTSASCKPFRTSSSLQRSPEVLPPRQQQQHHEKRMPDSLGEVSPILPTESPAGLSSLSAWQAVSEGRSSPSPPATAMDQHAAASSSKMVKGTTATDAHHHHDHEQEELSHPHFDAPLHVLPKYLIREAQRQLDAMCEDLTSSPLNARTWMCLYGYLQELPDEATRVILKSWSAPEELIHLLPANTDAVREEDEERRVFTQLRQEVLALLRGEEVHHDTHFEWLGRRVVIAPGRGMPLKRGCLGSIASNGSSGRFSALIIPSDDESEDGAAVADGLAEVVRRYSFVMRQGAHTQWPDEKDEEHGELVRSHTPETPSSISNTPSSAPSMDAITRQVLARIVNLREMWSSGVCPPDSRYFATEMMDLAHTAKEALGGVVAATPMLMPITTNIPATSMMHASRDDHDYGGACGADTTPVAATPHRATSAAQQNSARSPPSAGKPQKPSPLALKKALLATSPQKSGNTSARRRQTTATTTATSATVGTECEGPSVFERLYTPPSTSPTTSNPPSPRQKSARPTFNPYA